MGKSRGCISSCKELIGGFRPDVSPHPQLIAPRTQQIFQSSLYASLPRPNLIITGTPARAQRFDMTCSNLQSLPTHCPAELCKHVRQYYCIKITEWVVKRRCLRHKVYAQNIKKVSWKHCKLSSTEAVNRFSLAKTIRRMNHFLTVENAQSQARSGRKNLCWGVYSEKIPNKRGCLTLQDSSLFLNLRWYLTLMHQACLGSSTILVLAYTTKTLSIRGCFVSFFPSSRFELTSGYLSQVKVLDFRRTLWRLAYTWCKCLLSQKNSWDKDKRLRRSLDCLYTAHPKRIITCEICRLFQRNGTNWSHGML